MRKMLTAVALMLAVMMVASSSYAETAEYSGTYTGASAMVGLSTSASDPDLGDVNFGGVSFTGFEGIPLSISIVDATGSDVAWTFAQDLDGDTTFGEPGEPSVGGCGAGGSLSDVNFVEGAPTTAFIRSAGRLNRTTLEYSLCPGVATTGTIVLTVEA